MCEPHIRVTLVFVDKLAIPVFLGRNFMHRFIKPFQQDERKIVQHHSRPVFIWMVPETCTVAEMDRSNDCQGIEEDLALPANPTLGDAKNITVARQVVVEKMGETALLVSRKAVSLIEVTLHGKLARNNAFMTVSDSSTFNREANFN